MSHLFIAHPGHEILLHGWISRERPVVHVLTDGSDTLRLEATRQTLRRLGAPAGAIFGRLSDREAYRLILEQNVAMLLALAEDLASELRRDRPAVVVHDAAERYNPVHDLCRLIVGAAIVMADVDPKQYEYAVVNHPETSGATTTIDLSDAEYAAKMARASEATAELSDISGLLSQHGAGAYRRESFSLVDDWTAIDVETPPLYERYGEERVASGRYTQVIRQREHMLPLRDALRAEVEKRSCAF